MLSTENLQNKIKSFSKHLWSPTNLTSKNIESNSWFTFTKKTNTSEKQRGTHKFNLDKLEEVNYKCKKIYLLPTEQQKIILCSWMDSYAEMYNQTLKFFKKRYFNKEKITVSFMTIRTKYMKNIKEHICKITKIPSHTLDYAIKDACSMYKSALTNIKHRKIKHFRLRYIKGTKPSKILKLEKTTFSKNHRTFCKQLLGDNIATTDGSTFVDIECDCTLQNKYGKFILYVPIKVKKQKINKKKYHTLAIDPGVRTPYTGYSENHIVEIGSNMGRTVGRYIKQIDSINKTTESKGVKHRAVQKRYRKIENLVDEMHWKTIDYITKNYETILIGNLSTYNIVRNKLASVTKRLSHLMKLYVFENRLKYKCYLAHTKYRIVDEKYTSKMCTYCGNIKSDLGTAKIYNCNKCGKTIGRDINGARNIYMVDMKK